MEEGLLLMPVVGAARVEHFMRELIDSGGRSLSARRIMDGNGEWIGEMGVSRQQRISPVRLVRFIEFKLGPPSAIRGLPFCI